MTRLRPIPGNKRFAPLNGPDCYPTPAWATFALLAHEEFRGGVCDPACGDGAMSRVLETLYADVVSRDLNDLGYGETGFDFLCSVRRYDNIITNPPFNKAEAFVVAATRAARFKTALLLRLAFLEGAARANGLFTERPPSRVWVFSERVDFYALGEVNRGGSATAYAWFVWDRDAPRRTELGWIKPGFKRQHRDWRPV